MIGSTMCRVSAKRWKIVERRPGEAGRINGKEKVGRSVRGRMTTWEEGEEMENGGGGDGTRGRE
jgi:hypothetical protein